MKEAEREAVIMNTAEKERSIKAYFDMWVKRDFTDLNRLFSSKIYYSECYGPEYCGLDEIHLWVDAMLQDQTVLEWSIKRFIHENDTVVVEWFFKDRGHKDNEEHSFDGVSIIEFQKDGRISSIQEFKSKAEHVTPYH